jgi:hypothetical protein
MFHVSLESANGLAHAQLKCARFAKRKLAERFLTMTANLQTNKFDDAPAIRSYR